MLRLALLELQRTWQRGPACKHGSADAAGEGLRVQRFAQSNARARAICLRRRHPSRHQPSAAILLACFIALRFIT